MSKLESAELFAKQNHAGMTLGDGKTSYSNHLESIVTRLKSLGITDEEVLAAAWLHDIMEETDVTFDDIDQRFGSKVAVLVLSLSKDKKLPKKEREKQYVIQLKNASWQAQTIKLCDISANLKDLKISSWSRSKRKRYVFSKLKQLNAIKNGLSEHKSKFLDIQNIINGINEILRKYGLKFSLDG